MHSTRHRMTRRFLYMTGSVLYAGERADGPGGLRSKTTLDDSAPKRDNSQGSQPSASGGYFGDDPMYPTAP